MFPIYLLMFSKNCFFFHSISSLEWRKKHLIVFKFLIKVNTDTVEVFFFLLRLDNLKRHEFVHLFISLGQLCFCIIVEGR